jgi:hypothetical protein
MPAAPATIAAEASSLVIMTLYHVAGLASIPAGLATIVAELTSVAAGLTICIAGGGSLTVMLAWAALARNLKMQNHR